MAKTVEEFIESGATDILTYYNFSVIQQVGNVEYSVTNVISDYIDELKKLSVEIEMSNEEYIKYKYKPELLAYDLYGSTELFFVILAINGLSTPKHFTNKKILVIAKDLCLEVINNIYNSEEDYINNAKAILTDSGV